MAKKKLTPEPYAQETIQYTVAATAKQPAAQVDLVLTYNPTQTKREARGDFYEITGASGTYTELNANGTAAASYPINALLTRQTFYDNLDRLYLNNSAEPAILDRHGLAFAISTANEYRSSKIDRISLSYSGGAFVQKTRYGAAPVTSLKTSNTVTTQPTTQSAAVAAQSDAVTCFVAGTRILTTRGEIAVEALAVGDLVVTASGATRPVRWLGHRTIDAGRHPRPHEVRPVRIAANAFGAGKPARDLRVSPGHALCLDILGEVLIPAGALVDGAAVVQEPVARVTYWHVELESHDIILAENLPAESYLEMGNRGFFAEGEIVALAASPDARQVTHADFCRPYVAEGPVLEAARRQLAACAATPAAPRRVRAA